MGEVQIGVIGFNKKQTALIQDAAFFFGKILLGTRMSYQLDIEKVGRLDVQGECISEDACRNPRWFTINLRGRKDDDDVIKTLAHEMVHVKQYARNELGKEMALARGGQGLRIATRWQGEFWEPKNGEDAYWDAPWEIEAYGREVGLYQRWIEYYDEKYGK